MFSKFYLISWIIDCMWEMHKCIIIPTNSFTPTHIHQHTFYVLIVCFVFTQGMYTLFLKSAYSNLRICGKSMICAFAAFLIYSISISIHLFEIYSFYYEHAYTYTNRICFSLSWGWLIINIWHISHPIDNRCCMARTLTVFYHWRTQYVYFM